MNWIIKSVYPSGGHTVMMNGGPLRFKDRQAALDHAEVLVAELKKSGVTNTTYIVVEDTL